MTERHELQFPEAQFLCAELLAWGNRVHEAWKNAEPGSPEEERAQSALLGIGWLCCCVEDELRSRPDDFHVAEGLAAEAQRFLDEQDGER